MIREPLLLYSNLNKCIYLHHYGFLEKNLTRFQLLKTINIIIEAVENGDCVDVGYIDFLKTFDTVFIPKLMQELKFYSLHDNFLNRLADFLSSCTMHVEI